MGLPLAPSSAETEICKLKDAVCILIEEVKALKTVTPTPIDILTFTNNASNNEIGEEINSLTFNWTTNHVPTVQTLNGTGVTPASLTTKTLTGLAIVANTTYTLLVGDAIPSSDSATTTVKFLPRIYYGISPYPLIHNGTGPLGDTGSGSMDIMSLQNSVLVPNRNINFSVDGEGQYVYFAYPTSFGSATIKVGPYVSTAWDEVTVPSFTNASGYTQSYKVYRSNTVQFGDNINITIQ